MFLRSRILQGAHQAIEILTRHIWLLDSCDCRCDVAEASFAWSNHTDVAHAQHNSDGNLLLGLCCVLKNQYVVLREK